MAKSWWRYENDFGNAGIQGTIVTQANSTLLDMKYPYSGIIWCSDSVHKANCICNITPILVQNEGN